MRGYSSLLCLLLLVLLAGCGKFFPMPSARPMKVAPRPAAPPVLTQQVAPMAPGIGEPPGLHVPPTAVIAEAKPAESKPAEVGAAGSSETAPAGEAPSPAAARTAEPAAADAKPAKVEILYEDSFADLKGGLKK